MRVNIKSASEIDAMRKGGKMLASVLSTLSSQVESGMSTKALAENAKNELKKLGGQPTILGYHGFPDVL